MKTCRYEIRGGDFERAGAASADLKSRLKRIGVEPEAIRRAVIAAYEAEMNLVIHADKGVMQVELSPGILRIELDDEGPGIPDIEKAMTPGFSTAPPYARAMGFGAGMGLPNIQRHSDRFQIQSEVGAGTHLDITVLFQTRLPVGAALHSLRLEPARCRACLACVRACPTSALRVRGQGPVLLEHLCIDCGLCMSACSTGAIALDVQDALPSDAAAKVLVAPPALLGQFGPGVTADRIAAELRRLGFAQVRLTDSWEEALHETVVREAADAQSLPLISPVCPSVLNLIELRFPSLIPQVAPYLSPIEAAACELGAERFTLVVSCPSQRTALEARLAVPDEASLSLAGLRQALLPALTARASDRMEPAAGSARSRGGPADGTLEVCGIRHVAGVLERIENGSLADVPVVELYACEGGCFGGPLTREEPSLARYRWQRTQRLDSGDARAVPRTEPLRAREGVRLHPDMATAIAMLRKIDELVRELPGADCGLCGAPACSAFAEDVVLERADRAACVRLTDGKGKQP
ncbi:MAG: [Fe-Fe] hydrogenase large subunit C-terminal domain-containing protein [Planctomycetota bacterium]